MIKFVKEQDHESTEVVPFMTIGDGWVKLSLEAEDGSVLTVCTLTSKGQLRIPLLESSDVALFDVMKTQAGYMDLHFESS